jgi:hypothetical protein
VNLTLGVLRQLFNAAVREGLLVRNPAHMVDLLPQPVQVMALSEFPRLCSPKFPTLRRRSL